jgi:AcrR family transcriptional regulator
MAVKGAGGEVARLTDRPDEPSRGGKARPRTIQPLARPAARMPAAERRHHLLDVASEIIVEHGPEALTMEGLAVRAGVSKGLGYAYFANRDEILVAVFDRETAELDRRVAAAMVDAESFEDRIRATVTATFDTLAERGVLMGRLLQRETTVGSPLAARQQERQRVVERYYGQLAVDAFGLQAVVAEAAGAILLAGVAVVINLWAQRRMNRYQLEELYLRIVLGGLTALAEGPPIVTRR